MTLVEILIVMGIILVLAGIAFPSTLRIVRSRRQKEFLTRMRMLLQTVELYRLENGTYPADVGPGVTPANLQKYANNLKIDKFGLSWTEETPLGGQWDWDYKQFGDLTGVSVYESEASEEEMGEIDEVVDDGDLTSGHFRSRPSGYIWILEE